MRASIWDVCHLCQVRAHLGTAHPLWEHLFRQVLDDDMCFPSSGPDAALMQKCACEHRFCNVCPCCWSTSRVLRLGQSCPQAMKKKARGSPSVRALASQALQSARVNVQVHDVRPVVVIRTIVAYVRCALILAQHIHRGSICSNRSWTMTCAFPPV